jgi:para-nitrobenzyl esterase
VFDKNGKRAMKYNNVIKCVYGYFLFSVLGSFNAYAAYDGSLQRSLPEGDIIGKSDTHNTQAFLGIPFAKPPVGDLRWKAPRDPDTWQGVRDVSEFSSVCSQMGSFFGDPDPATFDIPIGSEDCLYLNVWRPQSSASNLPVLFWIHGGAQKYGAASEHLYHGQKLADEQNVIVVSTNYRLQNLGWLYHQVLDNGDAQDSSGNYGHLDLIKALQWVNNNITEFGGNPNNITISGQSAGCFNVWGLMINRDVESLFDKAVCSSGIPQGYPKAVAQPVAENALADALVEYHSSEGDDFTISGVRIDNKVTAIAWLNTEAKANVAIHLRGMPVNYLVKHAPTIVLSHIEDGSVYPIGAWARFLAWDYNRKPMIMGTTRDEGTLFLSSLLTPDLHGLWDMAQADASEFTTNDLITPLLQPTYFSVSDTLSYFVNLVVDKVARQMRYDAFAKPIYRYKWEWDNSPEPWRSVLGAYHAIDVAFMFGNFPETGDLSSLSWNSGNRTSREDLSKKMRKYLGQFMKSGNPNKWGDGLTNWDDWSNWSLQYKHLKFKSNGSTSMSFDEHYLADFHLLYNALSSTEKDEYDLQSGSTSYQEDDIPSELLELDE